MNNKYPALVATKKKPEYKENPYLPISSVGTDYTTANETNLPAGSALMTDTLDGKGGGSSVLNNNKGITHIIHAAPKPRGDFKNDADFIRQVVKSVQNSLFLADREDIQKVNPADELAICLVGGGIYLGACPPSQLAEGIIRGAINQLAECKNLKQIIFVDYDKNPVKYFEKAILEKFSQEIMNNWRDKVSVLAGGGDIRDKSRHGAQVIVNAANTYVGFGGGISGAIAEQVGDKGKIDQEAKKLIGKFYSLTKKEGNGGGNDNSAKISRRAWYARGLADYVDGRNAYVFFMEGGGSLEIDIKHPIFKNNPLRSYYENNQNLIWHKITWLKSKDITNNDYFSPSDFIEIEEEDKDKNTAKYFKNDGKDNKTCAACGKNCSSFSITKNGKDYCSSTCIEKTDNNGTKFTCPKCGKQFDNLPIVKDGTNYCSKKCSGEEKNDNENENGNKSNNAKYWISGISVVAFILLGSVILIKAKKKKC